MVTWRFEARHVAASSNAVLITDAILYLTALARYNWGGGRRSSSNYPQFRYRALVPVDSTPLPAAACVTPTLELAVSHGAALFTAFSAAFQTTSAPSAALNASVCSTNDPLAVSSCTTECAFCGSWRSHVTVSTWNIRKHSENKSDALYHVKKHIIWVSDT